MPALRRLRIGVGGSVGGICLAAGLSLGAACAAMAVALFVHAPVNQPKVACRLFMRLHGLRRWSPSSWSVRSKISRC